MRGVTLGAGLVVAVLVATGCAGPNSETERENADGPQASLSIGAPASGTVTVVAAGDIGKSPAAGERTARLVKPWSRTRS